jgi:hypothetical protein
MSMSSDNNVNQEIFAQERPEAPVSLKPWHRPVISRIEIAQTLSGPNTSLDGDGSPAS